MPLLDARTAEVTFAVITLLSLDDDAVTESALESVYQTASAKQASALLEASRVDALQEVEGRVVEHIVVQRCSQKLLVLALDRVGNFDTLCAVLVDGVGVDVVTCTFATALLDEGAFHNLVALLDRRL